MSLRKLPTNQPHAKVKVESVTQSNPTVPPAAERARAGDESIGLTEVLPTVDLHPSAKWYNTEAFKERMERLKKVRGIAGGPSTVPKEAEKDKVSLVAPRRSKNGPGTGRQQREISHGDTTTSASITSKPTKFLTTTESLEAMKNKKLPPINSSRGNVSCYEKEALRLQVELNSRNKTLHQDNLGANTAAVLPTVGFQEGAGEPWRVGGDVKSATAGFLPRHPDNDTSLGSFQRRPTVRFDTMQGPLHQFQAASTSAVTDNNTKLHSQQREENSPGIRPTHDKNGNRSSRQTVTVIDSNKALEEDRAEMKTTGDYDAEDELKMSTSKVAFESCKSPESPNTAIRMRHSRLLSKMADLSNTQPCLLDMDTYEADDGSLLGVGARQGSDQRRQEIPGSSRDWPDDYFDYQDDGNNNNNENSNSNNSNINQMTFDGFGDVMIDLDYGVQNIAATTTSCCRTKAPYDNFKNVDYAKHDPSVRFEHVSHKIRSKSRIRKKIQLTNLELKGVKVDSASQGGAVCVESCERICDKSGRNRIRSNEFSVEGNRRTKAGFIGNQGVNDCIDRCRTQDVNRARGCPRRRKTTIYFHGEVNDGGEGFFLDCLNLNDNNSFHDEDGTDAETERDEIDVSHEDRSTNCYQQLVQSPVVNIDDCLDMHDESKESNMANFPGLENERQVNVRSDNDGKKLYNDEGPSAVATSGKVSSDVSKRTKSFKSPENSTQEQAEIVVIEHPSDGIAPGNEEVCEDDVRVSTDAKRNRFKTRSPMQPSALNQDENEVQRVLINSTNSPADGRLENTQEASGLHWGRLLEITDDNEHRDILITSTTSQFHVTTEETEVCARSTRSEHSVGESFRQKETAFLNRRNQTSVPESMVADACDNMSNGSPTSRGSSFTEGRMANPDFWKQTDLHTPDPECVNTDLMETGPDRRGDRYEEYDRINESVRNMNKRNLAKIKENCRSQKPVKDQTKTHLNAIQSSPAPVQKRQSTRTDIKGRGERTNQTTRVRKSEENTNYILVGSTAKVLQKNPADRKKVNPKTTEEHRSFSTMPGVKTKSLTGNLRPKGKNKNVNIPKPNLTSQKRNAGRINPIRTQTSSSSQVQKQVTPVRYGGAPDRSQRFQATPQAPIGKHYGADSVGILNKNVTKKGFFPGSKCSPLPGIDKEKVKNSKVIEDDFPIPNEGGDGPEFHESGRGTSGGRGPEMEVATFETDVIKSVSPSSYEEEDALKIYCIEDLPTQEPLEMPSFTKQSPNTSEEHNDNDNQADDSDSSLSNKNSAHSLRSPKPVSAREELEKKSSIGSPECRDENKCTCGNEKDVIKILDIKSCPPESSGPARKDMINSILRKYSMPELSDLDSSEDERQDRSPSYDEVMQAAISRARIAADTMAISHSRPKSRSGKSEFRCKACQKKKTSKKDCRKEQNKTKAGTLRRTRAPSTHTRARILPPDLGYVRANVNNSCPKLLLSLQHKDREDFTFEQTRKRPASCNITFISTGDTTQTTIDLSDRKLPRTDKKDKSIIGPGHVNPTSDAPNKSFGAKERTRKSSRIPRLTGTIKSTRMAPQAQEMYAGNKNGSGCKDVRMKTGSCPSITITVRDEHGRIHEEQTIPVDGEISLDETSELPAGCILEREHDRVVMTVHTKPHRPKLRGVDTTIMTATAIPSATPRSQLRGQKNKKITPKKASYPSTYPSRNSETTRIKTGNKKEHKTRTTPTQKYMKKQHTVVKLENSSEGKARLRDDDKNSVKNNQPGAKIRASKLPTWKGVGPKLHRKLIQNDTIKSSDQLPLPDHKNCTAQEDIGSALVGTNSCHIIMACKEMKPTRKKERECGQNNSLYHRQASMQAHDMGLGGTHSGQRTDHDQADQSVGAQVHFSYNDSSYDTYNTNTASMVSNCEFFSSSNESFERVSSTDIDQIERETLERAKVDVPENNEKFIDDSQIAVLECNSRQDGTGDNLDLAESSLKVVKEIHRNSCDAQDEDVHDPFKNSVCELERSAQTDIGVIEEDVTEDQLRNSHDECRKDSFQMYLTLIKKKTSRQHSKPTGKEPNNLSRSFIDCSGMLDKKQEIQHFTKQDVEKRNNSNLWHAERRPGSLGKANRKCDQIPDICASDEQNTVDGYTYSPRQNYLSSPVEANNRTLSSERQEHGDNKKTPPATKVTNLVKPKRSSGSPKMFTPAKARHFHWSDKDNDEEANNRPRQSDDMTVTVTRSADDKQCRKDETNSPEIDTCFERANSKLNIKTDNTNIKNQSEVGDEEKQKIEDSRTKLVSSQREGGRVVKDVTPYIPKGWKSFQMRKGSLTFARSSFSQYLSEASNDVEGSASAGSSDGDDDVDDDCNDDSDEDNGENEKYVKVIPEQEERSMTSDIMTANEVNSDMGPAYGQPSGDIRSAYSKPKVGTTKKIRVKKQDPKTSQALPPLSKRQIGQPHKVKRKCHY